MTAPSAAVFPNALLMLGLDDRDLNLLDAVVAGAERLGIRRITALHVHRREPMPPGLAAAGTISPLEASTALKAVCHELRLRLGDVEVEAFERAGSVAEEMIDLLGDHDIDLVIMGRRPVEDAHSAWGPDGLPIVRQATSSVLVVPRTSTLDLRKVVVGLDFSDHSTEALAVAVQIADEVRAVYQFDLSAAALGSMTDEEFEVHLAENVRAHFDRDVRPLLPPGRPDPVLELCPATRASSVLTEAAGKEPLVLGSRGLTRLAAILLGSTAEQTAGKAHGPVLIVRKKGQRMGVLEGMIHR